MSKCVSPFRVFSRCFFFLLSNRCSFVAHSPFPVDRCERLKAMIQAQNKTIPCSRVSRAQKLIAMCWASSRNLVFLSAMAFLIMRIASLRLHPLNARCQPRAGAMLRMRIQPALRGKRTRELDEIFSRHNYLPIWMLMRRGNEIFSSKDSYFVDPRHWLPPPLLNCMVSRRFISHRLLSIRR